jgi:DNA-binding phage protein
MVDMIKFKQTLVGKGMSVEMLAEKSGIKKATLYRRINDSCESLTIAEVQAIVDALGLSGSEAQSIFFSGFVA